MSNHSGHYIRHLRAEKRISKNVRDKIPRRYHGLNNNDKLMLFALKTIKFIKEQHEIFVTGSDIWYEPEEKYSYGGSEVFGDKAYRSAFPFSKYIQDLKIGKAMGPEEQFTTKQLIKAINKLEESDESEEEKIDELS